jgi:hypothetical protein
VNRAQKIISIFPGMDNARVHSVWYDKEPAEIRSIVYREIAGTSPIAKISDTNAQRAIITELLVLGKMLPVINDSYVVVGSTIDFLHDQGFCLNCHNSLRFPDGDLTPLKRVCRNCFTGMPRFNKSYFAGTFNSWTCDFQMECVQYLLRNKLFLVADSDDPIPLVELLL